MIVTDWLVALGFVIFANSGGILGSFVVVPNIKPWYEHLKKPDWRPPNWAFAPVWTLLYSLIGYASYVVYRDGGGCDGPAQIPLIWYGVNLIANWLWSPIFFGRKDMLLALLEILIVDVSAVGTTYLFYKVNPNAGYLVAPYCLWLCVATALNYCIWRDNRKPSIQGKKKK